MTSLSFHLCPSLLPLFHSLSLSLSFSPSLSTIKKSGLFYCHPHLLRQLGVHTTVLGLIRTYLGISSGSAQENLLSRHRMHRLKMSSAGKSPPPVEDCCKFLCSFARISQENQRVLFRHVGYLLEHVEKSPGKEQRVWLISRGEGQSIGRPSLLRVLVVPIISPTPSFDLL